MMTGLVAYFDKMAFKTVFGRMDRWTENKEEIESPKYYVKRVTRDNLTYLKGKANTPIYQALKALSGF